MNRPASSAHPAPSSQQSRPHRIRIADSLGRGRTLSSGKEAHVLLARFPGKKQCLVLGLGPSPAEAAPLFAPGPVHWIECPHMLHALGQQSINPNQDATSVGWQNLELDELAPYLDSLLQQGGEVWLYQQGEKLFPQFWGPLIAQVAQLAQGAKSLQATNSGLSNLPSLSNSTPNPTGPVLLPGKAGQLLFQELQYAFGQMGIACLCPPPKNDDAAEHQRALSCPHFETFLTEKPRLFLSVNLRGLDEAGRTFHLLQSIGVPVILWFVDNPWLLLSALRQDWWKQACLLVTDPSFVPKLKSHGAKNVHFVPLACCESAFESPSQGPWASTANSVFFVGSSTFPRHGAYFAAVQKQLAQILDAEAQSQNQDEDHLLDFHWWTQHLGLQKLWPGNQVRLAGAAAQACGQKRRQRWLQAAADLRQQGLSHSLSLAGDAGWLEILSGTFQHLGYVDYNTALPKLYRNHAITLDVGGILLPSALNQRPFDVWAAGGFLLTAPNPGLKIFPANIVDPIKVTSPQHLAFFVEKFSKPSALRYELQQAWQGHLAEFHTYSVRIKQFFEFLA